MARSTWVYDPETKALIPKDEWLEKYGPNSRDAGFTIMCDLKPYNSTITGEEIGGRRQHREHLRAHGCIEVGNERLKPRTPSRPQGVRADLVRAFERHR